MRKLLRVRDILLLTLAGIGDIAEEIRDPMQIMSKSYENMYGFIPNRYKRNNFFQAVNRGFKTGDIEKIVKNDKIYLRLTSTGKKRLYRDFPILNLTRKWDRRWLIVVFDISEKSKSIRNSLRNKLKNIGFGMLQEAVWISPLSIGEDIREFIDSIGLSEQVFIMEISGFVLGDPKQLAYRVWNLDRLEKEYLNFVDEIKYLNQLIKNESDRIDKSEAKIGKDKLYDLLRKKREAAKENLEFLVNFPALPRELLPPSLQNIFSIIL